MCPGTERKIPNDWYAKDEKTAAHRVHSVKRGFLFLQKRKAIHVTARGEGTSWHFIKANIPSSFYKEKLSGKSFVDKQSEEVGKKTAEKHSSCNSEASYICKLFKNCFVIVPFLRVLCFFSLCLNAQFQFVYKNVVVTFVEMTLKIWK